MYRKVFVLSVIPQLLGANLAPSQSESSSDILPGTLPLFGDLDAWHAHAHLVVVERAHLDLHAIYLADELGCDRLLRRAEGQHAPLMQHERLVSIENEKCILCGLCVQDCSALGTGAISTVLRGTDKKVATPYDKPSEFCVGCLSCANVCPAGAIDYAQDETTRTIWKRSFELVFCAECGSIMGTPESVRHAVGADGEAPVLCDSCRKKHLADEMMQTYRYV